jgi:hypothetical protein
MNGKKTFCISVVVLVALLVLFSSQTWAQRNDQTKPNWYVNTGGSLSGEHYHLNMFSWEISGETAGGDYHLQLLSSPSLRGSGCCCTYLPCVLKNFP